MHYLANIYFFLTNNYIIFVIMLLASYGATNVLFLPIRQSLEIHMVIFELCLLWLFLISYFINLKYIKAQRGIAYSLLSWIVAYWLLGITIMIQL